MPEGIMSSLVTYGPVIILLVLMMIFMIVPQRRRDKKMKKMLDSIKVGDKVRTIGGVYGKVTKVKDDLVVIETGPDKMQIEFSKGAVSAIANTEFAEGGETLES
ncbi:MAG: preprotein translocase subunit YajC [Christensenellaceae bacterium]|jgi:preprotein translocase subunit YajC